MLNIYLNTAKSNIPLVFPKRERERLTFTHLLVHGSYTWPMAPYKSFCGKSYHRRRGMR